MKRLLCLSAVVSLAAVTTWVFAEDLKSGLQPGEAINPFDVVKCSGAPQDGVAVGTELCYRCKYGARPMVMVFARKADENVVALATQLDAAVGEHGEKQLKAFVSLLGADRDALEDQATRLGTDHKLANVPVVVPVEFENGPGDYGINPDAEVTVIVASKGKVVASHALAAGALNEDSTKAILADVAKLVN